MDAVQKAGSGHPGAPMGLADLAEVLWREVLRHNPRDPHWWDRDRLVLSNGHASMWLYGSLYLSGYDLEIEDLVNFRQLGSKTAGHPEYGECPGVETTTGPLGQGLANAVGLAMAEQMLAREFNRDGHNVIDHRTWVVVGDGCLMEGISHEAASLAGTLGLGKLIALYDDNNISIDGEVDGWFTEDVPARFEAYGWRVVRDIDGHDPDSISAGLSNALQSDGRPTLVCCKTTIGFGSPNKAGTAAAHGSALGEQEVADTRRALNWGYEPFEIPSSLLDEWNSVERGEALKADWQTRFDAYRTAYPDLADELTRRMEGRLPDAWNENIRNFAAETQAAANAGEDGVNVATRKSSLLCLNQLGEAVPELFGGSADLTGSNLTRWEGADETRHMSYGVREFAMSAVGNGLVLHGGIRPYSGTFLVFMEYARNAVRLAALMKVPNIFVYTHDSVAVGEDGPTHQPIEQLTNLRTTPGLSTWRPCDTVESAVAWEASIASTSNPSALIFSRQTTVGQKRDEKTLQQISRGGYVLVEETADLDAVIIATGSEVELAVDAAAQLAAAGKGIRVVSMPNPGLFLEQDDAYIEQVLPAAVRARVAVEAGHSAYWYRFVGLDGTVVGIDRFGVSAPGGIAMAEMGMTAERVVEAVQSVC
jgi:transketolase